MEKTVREKPEYPDQITYLSSPFVENPVLVLENLFMDTHLSDHRKELWNWLCAALSSKRSYYEDCKERSNLLFLYSRLLELAEAAYLLYKRADIEGKEAHKKVKRHNRIMYLTPACRDNPLLVFERFFEDYHLNELRIDLWHWLDATISDDNASYNNHKHRGEVLFLYYRLLELGEAGLLLVNGAGQKK